jgi:hypothetical protein
MAGCERPCRAQPADRSLVAEDPSARGVRDRAGPESPMLTRLLTKLDAKPRDGPLQGGTTRRHPPCLKAR